jgi:hypothetical protein
VLSIVVQGLFQYFPALYSLKSEYRFIFEVALAMTNYRTQIEYILEPHHLVDSIDFNHQISEFNKA